MKRLLLLGLTAVAIHANAQLPAQMRNMTPAQFTADYNEAQRLAAEMGALAAACNSNEKAKMLNPRMIEITDAIIVLMRKDGLDAAADDMMYRKAQLIDVGVQLGLDMSKYIRR